MADQSASGGPSPSLLRQIGRLKDDELNDLYRMNAGVPDQHNVRMAGYLLDEWHRRRQIREAAGPAVMPEGQGQAARDAIGHYQSAAPHQTAPSEAPSREVPSRVEAFQAAPRQAAPSEIAFPSTPVQAASLRPLAPATAESRAASTTPGSGATGTPPIGRAARKNLPRSKRSAAGSHSVADRSVIDRVVKQQKAGLRSGPTR